MTVCLVIPARMASTRLPRKPLQLIGDTPLIVAVAENIQRANVDRIVVAVDDEEVRQAVTDAGFAAEMTRVDHPSGSDRVKEVADLLSLADTDVVINVQGDEPLMPVAIVDQLAALMQNNPAVELATVSEPLTDPEDFINPNVVKLVSDDAGHALYFSRAPIPYVRDHDLAALTEEQLQQMGVRRHVGVYAFRVSALAEFVQLADTSAAALESIERLEQLRWLQAGKRIHVLHSEASIPGGVDTPEDLQRIRALLSS